LSNKIKLYPNPASTSVNIEFESGKLSGGTLRVTDVQGKTVLHKQITQFTHHHTAQLELKTLNPGIYMMQIVSGNGIATKKLTVY